MSEAGPYGVSKRWAVVDRSIHDYLDGRLDFVKVEDAIAAYAKQHSWLPGLFHALQHYDLDVSSLGTEDAMNMKRNMEKILESISTGDEVVVHNLVGNFFSSPWKQE